MKNGLTGEARFVRIIKLSVGCGKPKGPGATVKKDEKSHENRLTERIIFDTMIKHLSTGENMGKRGTIR